MPVVRSQRGYGCIRAETETILLIFGITKLGSRIVDAMKTFTNDY